MVVVCVCVQFYYGEDGLDVMKTSFIRCSRASDRFPPFSFLVGNRSAIVSSDDLSLVKQKTNVEAAPRINRKVHGKSEVAYSC